MAGGYETYLKNFGLKFNELFVISKNGSLVADWKRLEAITEWMSQVDTRLIIAQTSGLEIETVAFTKPYKGNIADVNSNKTLLLQLFGVCFTTYSKLCKLKSLNLNLDNRYHLVKEVDYISN
jgi:hypothetical protein